MIVGPIKSIRVPYPALYGNNVGGGWRPSTAACHQYLLHWTQSKKVTI